MRISKILNLKNIIFISADPGGARRVTPPINLFGMQKASLERKRCFDWIDHNFYSDESFADTRTCETFVTPIYRLNFTHKIFLSGYEWFVESTETHRGAVMQLWSVDDAFHGAAVIELKLKREDGKHKCKTWIVDVLTKDQAPEVRLYICEEFLDEYITPKGSAQLFITIHAKEDFSRKSQNIKG